MGKVDESDLLAALRQFVKAEAATHSAPRAAHAQHVTIAMASALTGLTAKAIRRKIEDGKWVNGREYRRRDGGIFVDMTAYTTWVERGG